MQSAIDLGAVGQQIGQQGVEQLKNVGQESLGKLETLGKESWSKLQRFALENRTLLQTVGLITLAAATGAVVGGVVAYSLAGKGMLVGKATASVTPLVTGGGTASQSTLLANWGTGSVALGGKFVSLLNSISSNAVPIGAGAASGGVIGYGVTQRQVQPLKQQVEAQGIQLQATQAETTRLQNTLNATTTLLNKLQTSQTELLPTVTDTPTTVAATSTDSLEDIYGIGRVYAQRLRAAGITTFAQLAQQTPDELREIVGVSRSTAKFQPQQWIAEARRRIE